MRISAQNDREDRNRKIAKIGVQVAPEYAIDRMIDAAGLRPPNPGGDEVVRIIRGAK